MLFILYFVYYVPCVLFDDTYYKLSPQVGQVKIGLQRRKLGADLIIALSLDDDMSRGGLSYASDLLI